MRISTFHGEKTLAELTTRLYKISGTRSEAQLKKAEEALLRANPHLGDFSELADGAPIVVPNVPGVKSGEEDPAISTTPGEVARAAREAFAALRGAVESSIELQDTQANAALELLKSRELKAAATRDPAVKQQMEAALQATQADQKDAQASRDVLEAAFKELQDGLDQLLKRIE
jgi:hypothetical protein